jgi:tetratricopeptide (TPR) repeat protein
MMYVRNARLLLAVVLCVVVPAPLAAQRVDGLELERRGLYEQAFEAYRQLLQTDPVNATAWLGIERVLGQLGRLESLIRLTDTVLAKVPDNRFVHEIQLRAWSSVGPPDSVAAAATRWIALAPDAADPYRQWAFAVARAGNHDAAIEILEAGRSRLGHTALAPELGRLHASAGDWTAAAQEWGTAVALNEAYIMSAVAALQDAPAGLREPVLTALTRPGGAAAESRLGAELLVMWGRAGEGWSLLAGSLSTDRTEATSMLGRFVERTRRMGGTEAARARGYALEHLAEISTGPEAERARLDAAQAFADAGELSGARRMLEWLAETPSVGPDDARGTMATVIRVTIELGRIEEAERQFLIWQERLSADEVEDLRRRLGQAWIEQGQLDRAEDILRGDSSIGSLALLGWVRLYAGDLSSATELFRSAGPYASSRDEATRRTAVLALIQQIDVDSVPGLGRASLLLASADTAMAIDGLGETAAGLPRDGGRAGVLTLAGELAVASGDYVRAESLLLAALAADSSGPAAPAAEFAIAVLLSRTDRVDQAKETLEHLILSYSDSAVVPEARRLLDQLMGAIPKS